MLISKINSCRSHQRFSSCSSLNGLRRLRNRSHRFGRPSLLTATAAPSLLLLGLLWRVERRQDGKCLSHRRLSRRCRSFLEEWLVVKVLAEEVGIADE
jgi:hypothetical protein